MKKGRKRAVLLLACMLLLHTILLIELFHYTLAGLDGLSVLQVSMDVCSMAMGVILFVACAFDGDELNGLKKWYLRLVLVVFTGLFTDALSWVIDGHAEVRLLNYAANTLLFLVSPLIIFIFYRYVLEYMDIAGEKRVKGVTALMGIGCILSVALRLLNLLRPIYFYIDKEGAYQRGSLHLLSNGYSFAGAVIIFGLILLYRKQLMIYQLIILFTFTLAQFTAVVYAPLLYGLTPELGTMMTILLLLFCVLNLEKSRARSAVEAELSVANRMQASMLPKEFPDLSRVLEYDLYASMTPAREVGGDFYDFFMLDEDHLAFLVADVSDKGVGAALLMAVSKAMVKMRAQLGGRPSEVLAHVDGKIGKNNDAGMFVTMWLGYLDLRTGHVVACNGGHDYPALCLKEKGGEYVIEKTKHGPPVGFIPGMIFPEIEFDMEPGDRIFLYTDGVNEAQGKNGEEFGTERLLEVLNHDPDLGSRELCRKVRDTANAFVGNDPQFDDMTMMSLIYRGKKK
ncbi:MAG: serine/threonine-protein phosphatase [Lachnospiraceae bacterium]|nr:serine/threonine-protein phosphatase [Lachnospiraceae bacterium]